MSIEGKIFVNAHYTRSVNIERDADSLSVVKAYIPTTRAMQTLKSMAAALKAEESPRAWSLVGPMVPGNHHLRFSSLIFLDLLTIQQPGQH